METITAQPITTSDNLIVVLTIEERIAQALTAPAIGCPCHKEPIGSYCNCYELRA